MFYRRPNRGARVVGAVVWRRFAGEAFVRTRTTRNRSPSTLVHLLDDDSLLIIFSLCRPLLVDDGKVDDIVLLEGGEWNREWWWHRLIQVCRRWRRLVLQSAFYLQVSLVCARGTPVADMLAHSPPVPLVIDHIDGECHVLSPEDEEGIILALQHRDRVRRIRIRKSVSILQKLITALDGEFPILDHLIIVNRRSYRPLIDCNMNLNFPEMFRAPHLHHLVVDNFATPIESPPFPTMGNLVTLFLSSIPSSSYFPPNVLLQQLSHMSQLEILAILFNCYNFGRDIEELSLHTPIMSRVTLPNLHWLMYEGTNAYLETLLPWVSIPHLERIHIHFFNRMIYSIPHLRQFMSTIGNLQLKTAKFLFLENHLDVTIYPYKEAKSYTLSVELGGRHLDWQVVSAAQVFYSLNTVFSAVEDLNLQYYRHNISSEWNRQADRMHWCELFGLFGKVKTLRVEYGLVEQVSLALQHGEGESPTELLPELQEISYSTKGDLHNAFTQFVDARQNAGQPVTVVHL
jgi:hypothetical protein